MLALADGLQVGELAAGDEQRHARVAEPERRQPTQLVGERERARAAGDDGVDDERRRQVVVGQHGVGVRGERRRERVDVSGRIERPAAAR